MGDPSKPGYCLIDGMPWIASEMWFDALTGGKMLKTVASENYEAKPLPITRSHKLYVPEMAPHGNALNPSVTRHEEGGHLKLMASVRVWNGNKSENFIGCVEDGELKNAVRLDKGGSIYNLEDLRLFSHGGELKAVAAASTQATNGAPRTTQATLTIRDGKIVSEKVHGSVRHEKNWMPCVLLDGTLKYVYSGQPLVVLDGTEPRPDSIPDQAITGITRGGSKLVEYKGGWLGVVHFVHHGPMYTHALLHYDAALTKVVKKSPTFYFQVHRGIEFCAGLERIGDTWFFAYGTRDNEAWLSEVPAATIDAML